MPPIRGSKRVPIYRVYGALTQSATDTYTKEEVTLAVPKPMQGTAYAARIRQFIVQEPQFDANDLSITASGNHDNVIIRSHLTSDKGRTSIGAIDEPDIIAYFDRVFIYKADQAHGSSGQTAVMWDHDRIRMWSFTEETEEGFLYPWDIIYFGCDTNDFSSARTFYYRIVYDVVKMSTNDWLALTNSFLRGSQ